MSYRFGRYEVVRAIASGGMAQVFEGKVVGAGGFERQVAIKAVFPHLLSDPQFAAMFLDEARIAASIVHPNVVGTHDVQQQSDQLFLVMDYVDGPTLQQTLSHLGGALPVPITLRVFLDVLRGLRAAHELKDKQGRPLNLVHRDLTPHNILLDRNGVAKIADFGIALADTRLAQTQAKAVKGKLPYMAPEQLAEEPTSGRADIYTLGVSLWQCVTGRRMFPDLPSVEIARRVRQGLLPKLPASVPRVLSRAIEGALERDPSRRYSSALEFATALNEAAKVCRVEPATNDELARFLRETGMFARHDRNLTEYARNNPLPRGPLETAHDLEALLVSEDDAQQPLPLRRPPPEAPPPPRQLKPVDKTDRNRRPPESAPPLAAPVAPLEPTSSRFGLWVALALVAATLFVFQLGPGLDAMLADSRSVQVIDLDQHAASSPSPRLEGQEPGTQAQLGSADAGAPETR